MLSSDQMLSSNFVPDEDDEAGPTRDEDEDEEESEGDEVGLSYLMKEGIQVRVGDMWNTLDVSRLGACVVYKMTISTFDLRCHVNVLSRQPEVLFELLSSCLCQPTAHCSAHPELS